MAAIMACPNRALLAAAVASGAAPTNDAYIVRSACLSNYGKAVLDLGSAPGDRVEAYWQLSGGTWRLLVLGSAELSARLGGVPPTVLARLDAAITW